MLVLKNIPIDFQVCCIVGGMAAQKQERLLKKGPEIVVATPGRFWELLEQVWGISC